MDIASGNGLLVALGRKAEDFDQAKTEAAMSSLEKANVATRASRATASSFKATRTKCGFVADRRQQGAEPNSIPRLRVRACPRRTSGKDKANRSLAED